MFKENRLKSTKILMLLPNDNIGSPAYERFESFNQYFLSKGYMTYIESFPSSLVGYLKILIQIFFLKPNYIYISQPPFKFWMIFVIPFLKIVLDIRDGWSIAIRSGYGGTVKPNKIKYFIVTLVEKVMLKKSILVITCTLGLKKYLSNKYNKQVLLITNGISRANFDLIAGLDVCPKGEIKKVFTCAGQFSEYGLDKVKLILDVIYQRYNKFDCIIQVVGANKSKNEWISEYLEKYKNMSYIYLEKVDKEELYSILKKSDYALTIIRDPDYEYGTKIFEYIACGLKVVNYFDEKNDFTNYFDGVFDVNFSDKLAFDKKIIREDLILEGEIFLNKYIGNSQ